MSYVLTILPFLILLIIGLLCWRTVQKLVNGKRGTFQHKGIVKAIVIIYAFVLVLAPFVYEILPERSLNLPQAPLENFEQKTRELEQAIYDGRLDTVAPRNIKQKWEATYNQKTLQLKEAEDAGLSIVVERKPENDNLIEGMYIVSVVYQGIDFSEKINKLDYVIDGQTLNFVGAGVTNQFNATILKKDLILSQFTGKRNTLIEDSPMRNLHYIYLKIPKDLKIEGTDDLYFNYTGEVEVE